MGLTYWFDAAPSGDPYSVTVRFTGRRLSAADPGPADSFQITQTLDRIIPGSGRIALTARVPKIASGEWRVTATPVRDQADSGAAARSPHGPELLPTARATGTTMYLPAVGVSAPGVRMGAWPALVGLGALVAFVVQGLLAGQRGLPTGRVLAVSVSAALVGVVGAKVYYLATHRQEKAPVLRAGMSVQGFVLAALTALALGARWSDIPLGPMLDASAPGLLFGMAIGRLGCLLGGCCAGRPTASRWGIWSSDRRVGVRRVPVQLMESSMAGAVATATLIAAATVNPTVDGLLLVAGLAAYILGRQLLFPLRGLPRLTRWGRRTTLVLAILVLVLSLAVLVDAPL